MHNRGLKHHSFQNLKSIILSVSGRSHEVGENNGTSGGGRATGGKVSVSSININSSWYAALGIKRSTGIFNMTLPNLIVAEITMLVSQK